MPDFDVKVVGLAVPALSAPVTTYRPAITVQNNGIHPANVSGICRMYRRESPGELLQTWNVYLATLAAGNTGLALADGYWTPLETEIGQQRLFTADIVVADDQNKTNDHLAPVTVIITAGEPPEPPIVTDHATQHEEGGTDELNVDGLAGELADDQPAKDHASKHEQGGSDVMSIAGLTGLSATPQTPAEHGNERHDPAFLDAPQAAAAIAVHDAKETAHAASTNLEHTANKGAASGYAELDISALVPADQLAPGAAGQSRFLRGNQTFSSGPRRLIAASTDISVTCDRNTTTDLATATLPGEYLELGSVIRFALRGQIRASGPGAFVIKLAKNEAGAPGWVDMLAMELTGVLPAYPDYQLFEFEGEIMVRTQSAIVKLFGSGHCLQHLASGAVHADANNIASLVSVDLTKTIDLRAQLVVPDVPDASGIIYVATVEATGQPTV